MSATEDISWQELRRITREWAGDAAELDEVKPLVGGAINTTGSFDASSIGPAAQYQGFSTFIKTGGSTWSLTGSTAALTPWTINQGILAIQSDGSLGATAGGLTIDGGTLQFLGPTTSTRTVMTDPG